MANYAEFEEKMKKTISALNHDFGGLRAGRANAAVLDRIRVEYYGASSKINEVAAVSVPEPRMLMIQPWDVSLVKEIEKAILASDIGITPTSDGKVIRLNFPQPTEERRRELAKDVKKFGEEAKVAVRNVRRDALDRFKKQEKAHEITEDELKGIETDIQKLTDKYVAEIDRMVGEKEQEIMAV
ncbi:MAG: ribosome recycling factor [Clostridiales bacterium]|nr:MAG: ribosome recycling factor [Clostridiales bacterium]